MTDQLSDISARIDGIRQLGTVVNAMKGIAAARVRTALTQVDAVDNYSDIIAGAMSRALVMETSSGSPLATDTVNEKNGILVFCAEQGFAGPFTERVLDSIEDLPRAANVLLIGTRGLSIAHSRGIDPIWNAAMPSQSASIPKLSDQIARKVLDLVGTGQVTTMEVIYTSIVGGGLHLVRRGLFPLDFTAFPANDSNGPLTQLPSDQLLNSLSEEYLHARICKSTLHAFASENQARMVAMSSAYSQIKEELDQFQATLRRVRQEAITAEIIELGTGTKLAQAFS